MTSVRRRLLRWLVEPEPPGLGLELRPGALVVARVAERRGRPELDLVLEAPVPEGIVRFSMLEPNLLEPEPLGRFLDELLEQAGVRTRRIALTLPDPLAHVAVVELPAAPRGAGEIAELLRFRLRKTLPFETDKARVAFEPLGGKPPRFLTGVMHEDVVAQYEDFLEELGFHVGVIETSSLSLLNLWRPVVRNELAPGADFFFVNVEETYFTVVLVRDRDVPVLVRTLGQRTGGETGRYDADELVRELVPTVLYYREKLGGTSLERVYYRSLRSDLGDLEALFAEQFEVPVEPLVLDRALAPGRDLVVEPPLAAAVGPAAGAARGRAA